MKKIGYFFLVLLLLAIVAGVYGYYWYQQQLNYLSPREVSIEINPGDGLDVLADKLLQKEVISNADIFQISAFLSNDYQGIQPGIHTIPAGVKAVDIIALFSDNPSREITVTIPEGLTNEQTIDLISQQLDTGYENLAAELRQEYHLADLPISIEGVDLEGFLFPDTYRFLQDSTTDQVITPLIQNFNSKWPQAQIDEYDSPLTDYEILILASIIEKEAFNSEERRIISEILQSRLSLGEPMAVNATLNYILDNPLAVFTDEEINYESEYNSYRNKGLPPTPICNPGLDSILAVIEPTPNNYYYYLHDYDGNIHYASTLDEHNQNVADYLN